MQMKFISEPRKRVNQVEDVFKAFLVEGAGFTDVEQYPILESWMIPKKIDPYARIIPFDRIKEVDSLDQCYISFYCRDKSFMSVRTNPRQYLRQFRRAKGLIGLDFSIYDDMPLIRQKSQINDNLSYTFFYGMRNIPIIPNIRYGSQTTCDEFLKAIPKHEIIAVGSYGCVRSKDERNNFRLFLSKILPAIDPSGVMVYGWMPDDVFKGFSTDYCFYHYPAYIAENPRFKGVA